MIHSYVLIRVVPILIEVFPDFETCGQTDGQNVGTTDHYWVKLWVSVVDQ